MGREASVSKLLIATTEQYSLHQWNWENEDTKLTVTGRQNPETEMAEESKKADYNYQKETGPAP